jgi:inosine triphosphate pyrophosphatase
MKTNMKTLYFITGNKGKFAEIQRFLQDPTIKLKQIDIDLIELQEVDAHKIIAHKAAEAIKAGYSNFFLEDTSLYINGLGLLPGPLIKWFLLQISNEGIYNLAKKMGSQHAVAETIIAFAQKGSKVRYFTGTTEGAIVKPKGSGDFGWGAVFCPTGANKSFGEMTPEEKHKWSMRIKAFKSFKQLLARTYLRDHF